MISLRSNHESISVSEFVMLLILLLLILIGFISSNPNYIIESFIVCIIAVIMFAIYLYIKKYAKQQTINVAIDQFNGLNTHTVFPNATIGILTVIMPLNTSSPDNQTSDHLPPSYQQIDHSINRLPTYEEIVQNR